MDRGQKIDLTESLNENTPLGYSFLSILGVVMSLAALLMFKDGDKPLVFRLLSLGLFCFFYKALSTDAHLYAVVTYIKKPIQKFLLLRKHSTYF